MKNSDSKVFPTPKAGSSHVPQRKWSTMEQSRSHLSGKAVCIHCNATLDDKRWRFNGARWVKMMMAGDEVRRIVCPACKMQEEGLVEGVVTVHAAWDDARSEQASHMLRREEAREREKNALQRIVSLEVLKDGLEVTTTTEFLARHLARALEKAFHGKLSVQQATGEKYVDITVNC